jgi:sodium-dependent dicarboxylate transporter 2/3/5
LFLKVLADTLPAMDEINFVLKKKLIVLLGGLGLFLLMLIMPTPTGVSPEGHKMAAVVMLMALWWIGEAVPLAVTALMPLILFPLLGIMSSKEVSPNYTDHLVFLFMGGFMIALAMEKWDFHKRIALVIIRFIGTSPSKIILGFMVATAFLSMWISNTATTMMMLPVAIAVVRQIASQASIKGVRNDSTRHKVERHFGLALMLGLAYSASIGGVGTLIGTAPNVLFAGIYKNHFPDNPEITFLHWMTVALPIVIVFLPLVWWYLCRWVTRVPIRDIEVHNGAGNLIEEELEALGPMQRAEKFVGFVFLMTALLWVFRQPIAIGSITIPGWSSLFPWGDYIHDSTVAMFMALVLMLVPLGYPGGMERDGNKEYFALDWKTVQEKLPWGILLLFGGGFALAAGFKSTGLDIWIGQQLTGIQALPIWMIILTLCLGITFLTEFTSNTATATMILPVIAGAAVMMDTHPLLLMVPVTISASFAFMMPVATPPNAIVFGSGWVTVPQMSRAGFILNFLGAALVTSAILLLVPLLIF